MNTEKGIQIYVRRGGERLGPFSWQEIRSKLESGEFEPREPAWHAGLSGWSTLGTVLNAEADRVVLKHSQAGIASAAIAGVSTLIALIFPILFALPNLIDNFGFRGVLGLINLLAFLGLVGLSLTGVVLGLMGSFDMESKRGWAQTGLVVNGLILLIIAGVVGVVCYFAYESTKGSL